VVISLDLLKALEASRQKRGGVSSLTRQPPLRAVSGSHLFPRFRRYRHSHPSQVCTVSGLRVGARPRAQTVKGCGKKTALSCLAHTRAP
jgi:hypothetical protein